MPDSTRVTSEPADGPLVAGTVAAITVHCADGVGCFDIIHIGHIRYLKEAKTLGDVLVIGINSDRSVSMIKPNRPIIPQDHRAILSSIEIVDYVTLFDEETPYELIKLLRPDILVKGGDWEKEDIVGSDIVKETRSLPYVIGISTSGSIERIKRL